MPSSSDQRIDPARGPDVRSTASLSSTRVPWRSAVRMPKQRNSAATPANIAAAVTLTRVVARIAAVGTSPAAARR